MEGNKEVEDDQLEEEVSKIEDEQEEEDQEVEKTPKPEPEDIEVEKTPKAEDEQEEQELPVISLMVLEQGNGPIIERGDIVDTFYKGRLMSGETFASNLDDEEPLKFTAGVGEVIEAWDRVFVGMN